MLQYETHFLQKSSGLSSDFSCDTPVLRMNPRWTSTQPGRERQQLPHRTRPCSERRSGGARWTIAEWFQYDFDLQAQSKSNQLGDSLVHKPRMKGLHLGGKPQDYISDASRFIGISDIIQEKIQLQAVMALNMQVFFNDWIYPHTCARV